MITYEELIKDAKYVTVRDGARIAYEEFGSGDNYILSTHQDHDPRSYLVRFADYGYHVIHMWNRSSGPSEPDCMDFSPHWYDVWADDVVDVADALGIDKFIYTGASHGAGTGWHILWRHQERVTAFIALVPGPHPLDGSGTNFKSIAEKNPEIDFMNCPTDDEAALVRRNSGKELQAVLHDHQSHYNYGKPMFELGTEEKLEEVLRTFTVPTLLIGGMEDLISPPRLILRTAKCLPNCKVVLYSKTAHCGAISETVEETMFEAIAFLENVRDNNGHPYRRIILDR